MAMDRRLAWVLGIVFGGGVLCFLAFMMVIALMFREGESGGSLSGPNRVGILEITGTISESKKALKEIREFKEDTSLKAVVVRIDSPGGGVAPSQEIYSALKELREKKKLVASMGSLAASGGYYIACAAEKIYANPGTLTGSIGVVMQIPNLEGILKWAGVEMRVITAGKLKDAGSPFRTMSPEERTYFESVLQDTHQQFIGAVSEGRGMPVENVQPLADGKVFTGRQAKEVKLVDELGGFNEAVLAAAKLAGLEGEPRLHYPKQERKFLRELLGDGAEALAGAALQNLGNSGLQYRFWVSETTH
jgi:protease IV